MASMKRTVTASASSEEVSVKIHAVVNTKYLAACEADAVRNKLADGLMEAIARLPYSGFHISEVKIK